MVLLKLFKRSDVVNLTLSCYSMEHDSTKVFLLLQPIYTLCSFSFFLKFVILSCVDYSDLELKQKQKKTTEFVDICDFKSQQKKLPS